LVAGCRHEERELVEVGGPELELAGDLDRPGTRAARRSGGPAIAAALAVPARPGGGSARGPGGGGRALVGDVALWWRAALGRRILGSPWPW